MAKPSPAQTTPQNRVIPSEAEGPAVTGDGEAEQVNPAANPARLKKLKAMAARRKLPFFAISAITGKGLDKLKYAIAERVAEHRKQNPLPPDPEPAIHKSARTKPHFPPTQRQRQQIAVTSRRYD